MKRAILICAVAFLSFVHASTFSISSSTSGTTTRFIVTRNDATAEETVNYRTVGLSAYAGQHFTEKSGTLTFPAGQTAVTNSVTERTPSADAYKFQTGSNRSYRFELTDKGGFPLNVSALRDIATGTSVPSSGAFNVKDVMIQSAEYTADDRGYDNNGYKSASSNAYFSAAAPKAYFQHVNAQLRMTLSMQAKENDDAYEYLQLLFNNTSTCDNRSGASNGDPGTPNLSSYMAGFEMDTGSKDDTYRTYTFPVTNVANNAGATNPWGYSSNGKYPLSKQKFNTTTSSRAADGRIVVPLNFTNIVLRLNASGSSGSDQWAAKSVKAHIQAVDSAAPTKLGISAAPGIHARGNEFYVSVAFSEPVTCSSATLTNTWGTLTYNSGNGSNVLTFKGTIGANVSGALNITGWSGTIKDLAGNPFVGSLSQSSLASFSSSIAYTIAYDLAGGTLPSGRSNPDTYIYEDQRILLANPLRPGYTFAGWSGTGFSGTRTTVTIPIHSHGDRAYTAHWTPITYAITYVHATNGVDGVVNANPTSYTIEDDIVVLADPTRTDYFFCGWYENPDFTGSSVSFFSAADLGDRTFYAKWIVVPWNGSGTYDDPYIISTREDLDALAACVNTNSVGCRVACYRLDADIAYDPAVTNSFTPIGNYSFHFTGTFDGNGHTISGISISRPDTNYQGLFGYIREAVVKNLTLADSSIEGQSSIGGIAGYSYYSSMQNCFVIGTTLSGVDNIGTSVGRYNYGAPSGNAYRYCAAVRNGSTFTSGIGTGNNGDSSGARPCYTLAFAEGIAPVTAPQFSFPVYGTNYSYYAADQSVIVRAAAGYVIANVRVNGSDATDNGDGTFSFTMPAADATVTADLEALPAIPYIDEGGETQVCSNYTVIASAAAAVEYGARGKTSWYVVTNDVTVSGNLRFADRYAHLILCDGATLTVTNENGTAIDAYTLIIYCQTNATGAVSANGSDHGIDANGTVTINGGSITATATSEYGIGINVNNVGITINGGSVTATGGDDGIYAGSGGNITLGWTNPTDSIYASSYYGSITVNGTLTDGVNIYRGSVNASDLAGKTLRPPMPAISYLDADGTERQRYAYTVLTNAAAAVTNGTLGAEAWYVVTNDVNISGMLHFDDLYAHLIVCDGATLTVTNGNGNAIEAPGDNLTNGGNLVLYGQANGTGAIVAAGSGYGIFAKVDVTINGGSVTATGGDGSGDAGIKAGVSLTINGGTVTATGYTSGIYADDMTINGGSVTATATIASIYADVTINGGSVTATATGDYGIYANGRSVTINGGSVTATGGDDGICAHNLTISGGSVTATGGSDGIYAGRYVTINGGSVTATGGGVGIYASGPVTINGGNVTATGGDYGINANGKPTLGWTNPTDSFYASSCNGGVTVNSKQFFTDGVNTYSGSVNASDIAGKTLIPAISYVDANGGRRYCTGFTILTNAAGDVGFGESGAENWYVVTKDVSIVGMLQFNGATNHLIVCNGAALTVTNMSGDAIFTDGNLAIYRQSGSGVRGTLTAYGDGYGIYAEEGVTTNGVDIAASGVHGDAIAYLLTGLTVNGRDVGFLSGLGWHSDGEHTVYLTNAGPFTVSGSTTAGLGIEVTTNAQVTLSDVLIDSSAYEDRIAFRVAPGANVELMLEGNNTLKTADGDSASAKGRAALEVAEGASVTIDGEGSLTAIAGTPDGQSGGAGIGGGYGQNAGTIEIRGGTITAQTYLSGAGIGGGTGGNGGTTTISGGIVSAQGRQSGIGGGYQGHGGAITISGGTVYARGTVSGRPDIGGMGVSEEASCIITGGSVHADHGILNPAATNANHVAVHCVTIAGLPADTELQITWLTAADSGYGQNDMRTDSNGRLYVWLPDGEHYLSVAGVGFCITVEGEDATAYPWSGAFVHYVDANGDVQQCFDPTVLTNAAGDVEYGEWGAENWYVVTNAVTISGNLFFRCDTAHLILCDGATLAVTKEGGIAIEASSLTIYGQTNGTGTVTAEGTNGDGISAAYSVTINGGTVTANGDTGISAYNGSVTINGGTVTANGDHFGIFAEVGSVEINGGTVTAESGGEGIYAANSDIILGWTKPTDSITASSYRGRGVSVKSGQRLTDGSAIYMDYLDPFDIAGVTLRPAVNVITTRAELAAIANDLAGAYELGCDIDLAGEPWTPIGNNFHKFTGSLDGCGHVISNLTVTADSSNYVGLFGYLGSSGTDARVANLRIANATVSGRSYVGTLAGCAEDATVTNCSVVGATVMATGGPNYGRAGGLIGHIKINCFVSRCFAIADVSAGSHHVGGFIGVIDDDNHAPCVVSNCFSVGSVSSTANCVGGFIGYVTGGHGSGSFVFDCYTVARAHGSDSVGGFFGKLEQNCKVTLARCYTAGGDGDTTGNSHVGGFAGTLSGSANCDNCFRLVDGLADVGSEESGGGYNGTIVALDAAEMRSTNNFTAFQAAGCWTQTDGQTQPYFDWGLVDGKFLLLAGDTATTTVNGLGAYAPGTDVPISINHPADRIFLGWTGGATYANASANETTVLLDNYHVVSVTLGTRITTRAQLEAISSNLSGLYGLDADIDLSGSPWTPIGSLGSPFTGKLYGHGHKIIGLTFDNTSSGDSAGARVGIFRSVDGATIDGVHLAGVSIKGYERCGALAGEVHGTSTICNCSAQGSVSGNYSYIGLLAGFISGPGVLFEGCATTGSVSAAGSDAGGFAGIARGGSVTFTDCHACADVTSVGANDSRGGFISAIFDIGSFTFTRCTAEGTVSVCKDEHDYQNSNLGGFIGYVDRRCKGTFTDCSANVSVSAGYRKAGGFVGYIRDGSDGSSFLRCTAAGDVSVTDAFAGGFVGSNEGNVSFTDCRADGHVDGNGDVGGFVGNVSAPLVISNCVARGDVRSSGNNYGGFAGTLTNAAAVVSDSWCSGAVWGTGNTIGSFVGNAGDTANGTIRNCSISAYGAGPRPFCGSNGSVTGGSLTVHQVEELSMDGNGTPWPEVKQRAQGATKIRTVEDLFAVTNNLAGIYVLDGDIDLGGAAWTPFGSFTGEFYGQNHRITNFVVNAAYGHAGFFGRIAGGRVSGVVLEGTVTGATDAGVGGFAGAIDSKSLVEGCSFQGAVTNATTCNAGGFVGAVSDSPVILRCCVPRATVSANISGQSDSYAGGFVASLSGGYVMDCYAIADVTGDGSYVGGFAGFVDGSITNAYCVGSVTSSGSYHGAFAGGSGSSAKITKSYYDYNKAGLGAVNNVGYTGVTGRTSQQMCYAANFAFDFDDVWKIDEGKTTPYLRPYIDTPAYPAYLGLPADPADDTEEDAVIRANYDAWALRYGYDALGANEAAFLLNIAPWATPIELRIAGIEVVEGGARVRVTATAGGEAVDLSQINGVISVSAGDDLGALAPKAVPAANVTYSEGEATIFVPASAGRFVKAVIGLTAPAEGE